MSSMAMSPIYVIDNPPQTIYATCYTNFAKASWFKKIRALLFSPGSETLQVKVTESPFITRSMSF